MATDNFFVRKGQEGPPYKIILRPSMIKFHVPDEDNKDLKQDLEICSSARDYPTPTFYKALIKALEGLCDSPESP